MLPVALGMDNGPVVTEIAYGSVYYVYAAGGPDAQLTLQLGPDLDVVGPNAANVLDVNDDGVVSPRDALLVINALNRREAGISIKDYRQYYLDTNGDGLLTPIDALRVINRLNRAEGEAEGEPDSAALPQDYRDWHVSVAPHDTSWIQQVRDEHLHRARRRGLVPP
jgi:hypothetical protein